MVGIEQSRLVVNTPGLGKEERATLPAGPGLKGIREPRPEEGPRRQKDEHDRDSFVDPVESGS